MNRNAMRVRFHSRDGGPHFLAEDRKSRPYSSTGLSASIGIYRLQANRFDGKSDGKNSQLLGGAGFYRHCLIIHVVNDYHSWHEDPSQASQRRPF